MLILHGRSIWFFSVRCFHIVFHVWTCQLTTEKLVMNRVLIFSVFFPYCLFSLKKTRQVRLHILLHFANTELTSSCQLCPAFKRDVKPLWNLRHEWFQGEETRNCLCCDHYKSLMNECSEILNPYMTSSVVQTLILLVHWWLHSQSAESILEPLVEVI